MGYELDGCGEWTEITFIYCGKEVQGYLNTLIADGGYWDGYYGDEFIEFDTGTVRWLEKIDATRPEC